MRRCCNFLGQILIALPLLVLYSGCSSDDVVDPIVDPRFPRGPMTGKFEVSIESLVADSKSSQEYAFELNEFGEFKISRGSLTYSAKYSYEDTCETQEQVVLELEPRAKFVMLEDKVVVWLSLVGEFNYDYDLKCPDSGGSGWGKYLGESSLSWESAVVGRVSEEVVGPSIDSNLRIRTVASLIPDIPDSSSGIYGAVLIFGE